MTSLVSESAHVPAQGRASLLPRAPGWERDPSHFPLPLTPSFASLYLPWQDAALTCMFAEYGYLAAGVRSRLIDGYLYIQIRPPGGSLLPKALLPVAARLWWAHPGVRARVWRSQRRLQSGYPRAVIERWLRADRPRVQRELRQALAVNLAALDEAALLHHFEVLCSRTAAYVRLHFSLHGAIAPMIARLAFLLRETPALAQVRLADLLAGRSSSSSEPGRALERLAAPLRERPHLLARARALGPAALAHAPERLDEGFAAGLRDWLAAYGHRITARYEFIEPALAEQPERVVRRVLDLAARPPECDAEEDADRVRRTATVSARGYIAEPALRRAFDEALVAAQYAYPVRDDNVVLTFNTAFATIRYALLEIGRRWAGSMIAHRDDIFFLEAREIRDALAGTAGAAPSLCERAATRRQEWERQMREMPPPVYLGAPLPEPPLHPLPHDAAFMTRAIVWYMRGIQALPNDERSMRDAPLTEAQWASGQCASGDAAAADGPAPARRGAALVTGIAAASGRYTGVARVVQGEADFDRLRQGDVLVCRMTSAAWSALFPLVGALVTDHGGLLSHPAVIAREYGIPAVVATGDATARIPDGATVTVDGGAGCVYMAG